MVKCLRQGGRRGGGGGQAGRVGVVRRLLQCLDQVVPILRIYGPQGAFAYALKERKKGRKIGGGGEGGRGGEGTARQMREMLLKVLSGAPLKKSTSQTQHSTLT